MRKQKVPSAVVGVLIAGAIFLSAPLTAATKGKASHVVVMVWDGMRRDFISPQYTPHLYELVTNGVFFKSHHPVYVSSTEVNGAAIATGCHPERSGIIANQDYRPEISLLGPMATEGVELVRHGDMMTEGNYLLVPTVAEILQQDGVATVTAGTKPVVFLHDRAKGKTSDAGTNSVLIYAGKTLPRSAEAACLRANDGRSYPAAANPNSPRDNWTANSVLSSLWKKSVPKYEDPEKGDMLVVGLGGSSSVYVYEHDETVIRNLVEFRQVMVRCRSATPRQE